MEAEAEAPHLGRAQVTWPKAARPQQGRIPGPDDKNWAAQEEGPVQVKTRPKPRPKGKGKEKRKRSDIISESSEVSVQEIPPPTRQAKGRKQAEPDGDDVSASVYSD